MKLTHMGSINIIQQRLNMQKRNINSKNRVFCSTAWKISTFGQLRPNDVNIFSSVAKWESGYYNYRYFRSQNYNCTEFRVNGFLLNVIQEYKINTDVSFRFSSAQHKCIWQSSNKRYCLFTLLTEHPNSAISK